VLRSIRDSVPSRWNAKVEELRALVHARGEPTLARYLEEAGLEVEDVYDTGRSWSELRADAGVPLSASGPSEKAFRSACGRLLHVDDRTRLEAYARLIARETPPELGRIDMRERRFLRMILGTLADKAVTKTTTLEAGSELLWKHPEVRRELLELLDVLRSRVAHLHHPLETHPDVPLRIHGRYSRIEILAAFGIGDTAKVAPWQTGVYWAREQSADLLAFTLDKTSGKFSPTTRYRDYAISRDLIHWESQSVTRADGETGLRYQYHVERGSTVQLFARLRSEDRAFWFLGPADYVSHEGELPMAVTWRLHRPLPGDLFATFAAAVA